MDGKFIPSYSGFVNITTPVRELNVLSATDFREQKRGDDYGADTDWFDELTKRVLYLIVILCRLWVVILRLIIKQQWIIKIQMV